MSAKTLASHISTRKPASIKRPEVGKQTLNSAGKSVFVLSKWDILDRFLILGSEQGSYYASSGKLTADHAKNVLQCIKENGKLTVDTAVSMSVSGRAAKNDPALMVLALCAAHGNDKTKAYAMKALPEVARTGTHLFNFAEFVTSQRGWGRLLKEGVARWYTEKPVDKLAMQVIKYQSRENWSHSRLIKLSHPVAGDPLRNTLFKWVRKGSEGMEKGEMTPSLIVGMELLKRATSAKTAVSLIEQYGLPREAVPTNLLNDPDVWHSLLPHMGLTAMLRNLGKMSNIGLLRDGSDATRFVLERMLNPESLRKERIHPYNVLVALTTYQRGCGLKGSSSWPVVRQIANGLNETFYASFGHVSPSNKRTLLCMDVSSSMSMSIIQDSAISAAMGSAAMVMATIRSEPVWEVMGFSHEFKKLDKITPHATLNEILEYTKRMNFGATDCSLPMEWAKKNRVEVDTFIVYTDNETNANRLPPHTSLENYRQAMGIGARMIVVAMSPSRYTIANSKDGGMLDVIGFDSAAPNLISAFSSGGFSRELPTEL